MIDLNKLQEHEFETKVDPVNEIFEELGNNTYDYKDTLSELIDNSIAARRSDKTLKIEIKVTIDDNNNAVRFTITDNALGISRSHLGNAISPAGTRSVSSNTLNEHGLGMKQAVAALGELDYLATKTEEDDTARVIREFKFGDIKTYVYSDFPLETGTEISVVNIKPILVTHSGTMTRTIVRYLGARYRKYLKPGNKRIDIRIKFISEKDGTITNEWTVPEIKPVYFHPGTRTNKPVIEKYELSGAAWKARLTFGYAPDSEYDYEELGIEPPNTFHPYRISINTQGLDILLHDRVILFHQLHEIGVIDSRHNRYNRIRGEIELITGFSTAITKNAIISDRNFLECMSIISSILRGEKQGPAGEKKNYIHFKTYPDQIPENLLRDRLKSWLLTNKLTPREEVHTEYVLEGIEGFIDVRTEQDVWELKTEKARALDVYQLFMYMDIGDFDLGFLVAPDFTTGAKIAAKHINEKHEKIINLTPLKDLPITESPSREERDEYY